MSGRSASAPLWLQQQRRAAPIVCRVDANIMQRRRWWRLQADLVSLATAAAAAASNVNDEDDNDDA